MFQEVFPAKAAGEEVKGREENEEDEKKDIDIREIAQDFLPADTAEEKIEKNKSQKENDAEPNPVFFHSPSGLAVNLIIGPLPCQTNSN
jgi:hypothetical protein